MKEYTLADAMHLLAITNRQLDRLLAIAGIDKQSLADASSKDKRRKLLSQQQFDTLASLHNQEPAQGDHEARIRALEQEVKQLRALLKVQSISPRARPPATVTTERRPISAHAAQGKDWYTGDDGGHYGSETHLLTAGYIGILAERHRPGAQETARKSWAPKMPTEARQTTAAAVLWMMANREGLGRCDDSTCPCSDV